MVDFSNVGVWRMWSTSSLPLLPGPLWPRVVAPDKGLNYGSNRTVWYSNWVQTNDMLNWTAWNRTVQLFNCV